MTIDEIISIAYFGAIVGTLLTIIVFEYKLKDRE